MQLGSDFSRTAIAAIHSSLDGKEHLIYDLFDWLKERNLTAKQAIDLLNAEKSMIDEALSEEIMEIML